MLGWWIYKNNKPQKENPTQGNMYNIYVKHSNSYRLKIIETI